jgi:hypothetical protein
MRSDRLSETAQGAYTLVLAQLPHLQSDFTLELASVAAQVFDFA